MESFERRTTRKKGNVNSFSCQATRDGLKQANLKQKKETQMVLCVLGCGLRNEGKRGGAYPCFKALEGCRLYGT